MPAPSLACFADVALLRVSTAGRAGLAGLALGSALLASSEALAADLTEPSPDWHELAEAWARAAQLPFPDAQALRVREVFPWPGGARVRLAQELAGLPVVGREVVLAFAPDGALRWVQGEPVGEALLDAACELTEDEARGVAVGVLSALEGQAGLRITTVRPAVLVEDRAHLVWDVRAVAASPPSTWRVLVDAQDGAARRWARTSSTAEGLVYPSNPDRSQPTVVELQGVGGELASGYATVASCADFFADPALGYFCLGIERQATPDANGDFLFDPAPREADDPFAEVHMQYHLDTIGRWFDERYGFRHPEPLEGLVNFEFANAFYGDFDADGVGEVAFGEWADSDLAYDADVIYHEFGHSVFGRVVVTEGFLGADEYGREYAPGALNEGSADALALVHTGDPDVGEYAGRALFGEERPIRALGDLRRCPEDLYGEIHVDGEVWGSLMWQIQDRLGASVAADLAYGSLLAFPDELSWEAAGEALRATAEELAAAGAISPGERDAVIDLGEQSGVIGCGRAVDLLSGASPRQLLISASIFEEETFIPAGVQFSVEVPAGGSRLRFRITDWESSSDAIGWRLLARRGREVHHEVRRRSIGPWTVLLPQPWNFDLAIDGEGGDFELEIDRQGWISTSGEPYLDDLQVLRPGETYYFAIASRVIDDAVEFAQANVTVEADLLVDPSYRPPLPGSGCTGCQPEDDEPGFTLGLLLGLPWLLGLLGRRRQGAGGSSRAI